ncbi:hypothetical protein C2G38_2202420 [Gigaspora rosea]|uniref:DNA-directed DNA polymerase family B exonuclease domain-containing protein n=1 Tax=Gigaspora rosea TaxID=44941 RepID=A0A397UWA3_9GLOM|nr:hypothetical protein C2G38_2202420 [Gigaspora rosea]
MPIVPASFDVLTVDNQNFQPEIDIEKDNSGAFYRRGFKAFPQSQISENGKTSQLLRYFGEDYLIGIPTRNDIVIEDDKGLTAILEDVLSKRQDILFMAVDIEESTEFINGQACYILRLYGPLINRQKAVVSITGIQVFFDILMPEDLPFDLFETKIRTILFGITKWFRVEHVKAYPFRGYYPDKKSYLRIYTTNTKQRKFAMKAIQEKKYITASDNQSTYYRKVAQDIATLKNQFPIWALTKDRTLVIAWDIETYSLRRIGELPVAQYDKDRVFTICMTLHWKDDPRPLKQICLVDVESAPEP